MAEAILRRLKCDNDTMRKVCLLIRQHDEWTEALEVPVRKLLSSLGEEMFFRLIKVQVADVLGQSMHRRKEKFERIYSVKAMGEMMLARGDCISLKELAVTGEDVMKAGCEKGPKVGAVLQAALNAVLENPKNNTREYLLEFIKGEINR